MVRSKLNTFINVYIISLVYKSYTLILGFKTPFWAGNCSIFITPAIKAGCDIGVQLSVGRSVH